MRKSKLFVLLSGAVLVLSAATLVATTISSAAPPQDASQQATKLFGLRKAPNIPVRSIILRRDFPDHAPSMQTRAGKPVSCDKDVDLTTTAFGVVAIAAQDTGICTNADLDTYVRGSNIYVVQAGGDDAAWTHTDVTNPASPSIVGQFRWVDSNGRPNKNTYTPDIKTFRQGNNDYIVMGLERRALNGFCGVVIYDVTDPGNPIFQSQYIGGTDVQNFGPFWCDTHNIFVENDDSGNGQYIYATADGPNDMRVLDISGETVGSSVTNPIEIGHYVSPTADNNNYVHDITVINHSGSAGRRVYLAYWNTGVVILNAADVTPGTVGTNPTPIAEFNPDNFLAHHAFASEDGSLVFIQDEFLDSDGDEPVQMWDVSDPNNPTHVDSLVLGVDVPANPAHNLEIRFDINPNRLYVGWYKMGLHAWDFTSTGFIDHSANPAASSTAVQYHQAQTEATDGAYSGAWGVRMENITIGDNTNLYIFQSDRNFGLIIDCVGCEVLTPPPPSSTGDIKGKVTNASTGRNLGDVFVEIVGTIGQSDITNKGGKYNIGNVEEGDDVTVRAYKSGFAIQEKINIIVTADQTITVNFDLAPE